MPSVLRRSMHSDAGSFGYNPEGKWIAGQHDGILALQLAELAEHLHMEHLAGRPSTTSAQLEPGGQT